MPVKFDRCFDPNWIFSFRWRSYSLLALFFLLLYNYSCVRQLLSRCFLPPPHPPTPHSSFSPSQMLLLFFSKKNEKKKRKIIFPRRNSNKSPLRANKDLSGLGGYVGWSVGWTLYRSFGWSVATPLKNARIFLSLVQETRNEESTTYFYITTWAYPHPLGVVLRLCRREEEEEWERNRKQD